MRKILFIFLAALLIQLHTENAVAQTYNYGQSSIGEPTQDPAIQTFAKLCGTPRTSTTDPNTHVTTTTGIILPNKITGNIVRCAENVINYGADALVNTVILKFSYLIFYCVTLAIIFHGIRMMFGMASHHGLNAMLIIKIIGVLYFCSPLGFAQTKLIRITLIDYPKSMVKSILWQADTHNGTSNIFTIVASVVGGTLDSVMDLAKPNEYLRNTDPLSDFYDRFDEEVLKALGVNRTDAESTTEKPNMLIGIVVLLAGLFFTGPLGVGIAMVVITYMTALFFAIAEIVLYFIVVAIAINFLVAITPLALACVLFEPTTRITKTWFSYLLIYAFQPIMLAVFVSLSMFILARVNLTTEKTFEKLKQKWENADGKSLMQASLSDCMGLYSGINDNPFSIEQWTHLVNRSNEQVYDNTKYRAGNMRPEDYQRSTRSNCNITANVIILDDDDAALAAQTAAGDIILTRSEVRQLVGLLIATLFLMACIISFIRYIPEMINSILGNAGTSGTLKIVTTPSEKAMHLIERSGIGLTNMAKRF